MTTYPCWRFPLVPGRFTPRFVAILAGIDLLPSLAAPVQAQTATDALTFDSTAGSTTITAVAPDGSKDKEYDRRKNIAFVGTTLLVLGVATAPHRPAFSTGLLGLNYNNTPASYNPSTQQTFYKSPDVNQVPVDFRILPVIDHDNKPFTIGLPPRPTSPATEGNTPPNVRTPVGGVGAPVPEPGASVTGCLLGTALLLGLARGRRKRVS